MDVLCKFAPQIKQLKEVSICSIDIEGNYSSYQRCNEVQWENIIATERDQRKKVMLELYRPW